MLTTDVFDQWMSAYGKASRDNDPHASASLFTEDAQYYETPFSEPIVGREAIYQYWQRGAETLKDKSSQYEIIAVEGNLGVARWKSRFTSIKSGKRHDLDCLFLVEFDEQGTCCLFREWWHIQEIAQT